MFHNQIEKLVFLIKLQLENQLFYDIFQDSQPNVQNISQEEKFTKQPSPAQVGTILQKQDKREQDVVSNELSLCYMIQAFKRLSTD